MRVRVFIAAAIIAALAGPAPAQQAPIQRYGEKDKEKSYNEREQEKEAATFQSRLSKFKDQLSAVKTNREYQAMQLEIETAQKELGIVEERVLERMMEADALSAEIKKAEQALAAQQKEAETEKKTLAEELVTVEAALKDATERRHALVKSLPSQLLALFEQVSRARKGLAIAVETDPSLPAHLVGDPLRLGQVLVNLLSNAVKFTEAGRVTVATRLVPATASAAAALRIDVEDTGIGLDPQGQDRLFQSFYTTKPEGMGMGLTICRSIIEAHGGRLWAENNSDRGATFCFTVPVGGSVEGRGSRVE